MGNPPFGKVKDTPAIRERFRCSLHGHPNLYGLFTDLGLHLAKPDGGVVAYLTPASFLAGSYFKGLRRLLHEEAPPVTLDLVESRRDVCEDVLQEVALSAFERGNSERRAGCAVVRVTPDGMVVEATGALVLPADAEEPRVLPRSADDARLVGRLSEMPARLADWATGSAPARWCGTATSPDCTTTTGRAASRWSGPRR